MNKTSVNIENYPKTKVTELEQIFEVIGNKPYYSLKYKKVGEDYYHIGYSSYDFKIVMKWKDEYFEIVGDEENGSKK